MTDAETHNHNLYENPLGTKPIGKLLVEFSVPAIISCLINSVYNIVDQVFIGQGVGYLGNAATTIAFPIMTILLAFGTLTGSGAGAYAAGVGIGIFNPHFAVFWCHRNGAPLCH